MGLGIATLSALTLLMTAQAEVTADAMADEAAAEALASESEEEEGEAEVDLDALPANEVPQADPNPPPEGPQYVVEPETRELLSWILMGSGGVLLGTGVGLYISHLAVALPLAELADNKENNPHSSGVSQEDYLEQKQTADILYISAMSVAGLGALSLAGGLIFMLLPDESFEQEPSPQ